MSPAVPLLACIILVLSSVSHGFLAFTHNQPATTRARILPQLQISFGGGNTSSSINRTKQEFPKDVKDAVSKCRAAVQEALTKRQSRMDVEFPVGAKFGVEPISKKQRKQQQQQETPTRQVLDTSNRELARLFVDMFAPVGGENIAVVFADDTLADQARKQWKGDPTAACRIMSLNKGKKKQGRKKKPLGFAAKMEAEVGNADSSGPFNLPENIEVALFVAPEGPKSLLVIERICNKVGQATLVILLNARLASIEKFPSEEAKALFLQEFEPVFSLCAAPQDVAPGCLLHRSYPSEWLMARKPKVGQPKVVSTQVDRPTKEDCKQAFESIEVGELEKNVEGLVENVAGWFS